MIINSTEKSDTFRLEAIIEVTTALCEIALKCDSCAIQFREVIQEYYNKHGNRRSGSLLDFAGQAVNGKVPNVQLYSASRQK